MAKYPNDNFYRQSAIQIYTLSSGIYEEIKNDVSLKYAEQAFAIAKAETETDPANAHAKFNLARAESRVGICLVNVKRIPEAIGRLENARARLFEINTQDPGNFGYQRSLAIVAQRLGDAQTSINDYPAARRSYENAAEIQTKIAQSDEKNLLARRDLALALKLVGITASKLRDYKAASDSLTRAQTLLSDLNNKNALGETDRKLITEVDAALAQISGVR